MNLEERMRQILALKIKEYALETRKSEYEVDEMLKKELGYKRKRDLDYKGLGIALETIDNKIHDYKK